MAETLEEKLLNPQFKLVEDKFGYAVPWILRSLYANSAIVLRKDIILSVRRRENINNPLKVKCFTPIDSSCFSSFPYYENFITIATDGEEGLYFIDPTESDPQVYLFILDSYDFFPLEVSLSDFINELHKPTIAPELPKKE